MQSIEAKVKLRFKKRKGKTGNADSQSTRTEKTDQLDERGKETIRERQNGRRQIDSRRTQ